MRFKDYLGLLRVKHWRGYLLIAAFGFVVGNGFLFPLADIALFCAILFFYLGFAFSLNDCFDTKEDRLTRENRNPVAGGRIGFRSGFAFSVSLALSGLALSAFFGFNVFLFLLITMLLVFFYSVPPLRMKSRPLLDLVSHGLFAGAFIFLMPIFIFSQELTSPHYLIAFSLFYFSMILELRNHTEDYKTDKKAGLKTTACALGLERSERLLKYLILFYPLVILPILLSVAWQYFFLFFIFTLVFFFLFLIKDNYGIVRNYKAMDGYTILSLGLLLIG